MSGMTLAELWPFAYPHLTLRTPDCPGCGQPGYPFGATGLAVAPQAVCLNDDCNVWFWDPLTAEADLEHRHDPALGATEKE